MNLAIKFIFAFGANVLALWVSNAVVSEFIHGSDLQAFLINGLVLAVVNLVFWPLFKLALSPVIILGLAVAVLLLSETLPIALLVGVVAFVLIAFFARILLLNLGLGLVLLNAAAISLLEKLGSEITVTGLLPLFYASLILGITNIIAITITKQFTR